MIDLPVISAVTEKGATNVELPIFSHVSILPILVEYICDEWGRHSLFRMYRASVGFVN